MSDRDQWLAERRTGIGGSDAGAILGVNKYRTALDVYLDKTGQAEDQVENDAPDFFQSRNDPHDEQAKAGDNQHNGYEHDGYHGDTC